MNTVLTIYKQSTFVKVFGTCASNFLHAFSKKTNVTFVSKQINLYSGVSTGIEDLPGMDFQDGHGVGPGNRKSYKAYMYSDILH